MMSFVGGSRFSHRLVRALSLDFTGCVSAVVGRVDLCVSRYIFEILLVVRGAAVIGFLWSELSRRHGGNSLYLLAGNLTSH